MFASELPSESCIWKGTFLYFSSKGTSQAIWAYIVDTLLNNLFCSPYILELHFPFGISLILSVSNTDDCTCLLEERRSNGRCPRRGHLLTRQGFQGWKMAPSPLPAENPNLQATCKESETVWGHMTLVLAILVHLCWSHPHVSSSEPNLGRKKEWEAERERERNRPSLSGRSQVAE